MLANAGLVRVTGDDGKPASLPDLPRQKLGTCTFRGETTIITIAQRMPVRGNDFYRRFHVAGSYRMVQRFLNESILCKPGARSLV